MGISEAVYNFLNEKKFKKIGILCSGGVDSMSLLHSLTTHSKDFNTELVVLHAYEKNDYEDKVMNLITNYCIKHNLKLITQEIDTSENNNILINLRKTKFNLTTIENFDSIVSGHHLDDQIETFLFRLFRGSGISGLHPMSYESVFRINDKDVYYYRPLLSVTKEEILQYSQQNNIEYFNDPFNSDPYKCDRNFIRLKIIPLIKSRFTCVENNIETTINSISLLNMELHNKIPKNINGAFDLEEFNNCKLNIKVYIIKEYLRLNHGYNMNKKLTNHLKLLINDPIYNGYSCYINEYIHIAAKENKFLVEYLK